MRITKQFIIAEVRCSHLHNAPFRIMLMGNGNASPESESSLTLDADACMRFGISLSHDLVGRTLEGSFQSCSLRRGKRSGPVDSEIHPDDLLIKELRQTERVERLFYTDPPRSRSKCRGCCNSPPSAAVTACT